MNLIPAKLITIIYYRISVVVLAFLILGCVGASLVVYSFAFRTPVPSDSASMSISQHATVAKGALDRIQAYADAKHKDQASIPTIMSSVFYVPPKSQ